MMAVPTQSKGSIIFAVLFYFIISIVLVVTNKLILEEIPELPLTFLWLQLVVAVILLKLCGSCGLLQLPKLDLVKAKSLWQLILINVIGLSFNTLCLNLVDVSFFQVARALVLPLTVFLQWWLPPRKASSNLVLMTCGFVVAGYITGAWTEFSVSMDGVLYGCFSSITTAYHAVVIKSSIASVTDNTMDLVFYNNVFSAIAIIPIVLMNGELEYIIRTVEQLGSDLQALLVGSLVTGFFGFLINIATFLQIKVTSAVTHMISSAVRGVLQTLIALFFFNEYISKSRVIGIVLVLFGSSCYTWVRHMENLQEGTKLPTTN